MAIPRRDEHPPAAAAAAADVTSQPAPGLATLLSLTAYWFGLSILWGAITTIVLPDLVGTFVAEGVRGSALALVAGLQAVVAIVVQPLAGAASDRLPTPWGRRRPWMFVGVTVQVAFVVALSAAGGYWTVLAIMLLIELASNSAQGPYQALLPDLVPRGERGLASGLLGAGQLAGQVVGVAAAGVAVALGEVRLAILLAGLAVWLGMLVTVVRVHEPSGKASGGAAGGTADAEPPLCASAWVRLLTSPGRWTAPMRTMLLEVWGRDILEQRDYLWLLASRLAILMATGTLQAFILYYLASALDLGVGASAAVPPIAGLVVVVAVLSAVPAGAATARYGRVATVLASALFGVVGAVLFALAPSYASLFPIAIPFGIAIGAFLAADWALLVEIVPAGEAGRYLGLSNTVTAGAGLLSVAIAGPLADLVNGYRPGAGYRAIFVLAAVEFLVGAWAVRHVREPKALSGVDDRPIDAGAESAP